MSSINGNAAGSHSQKSQSLRDIQLVLGRWGVWARYSSGLDYSSIAAGFKGLLVDTSKSKVSCCDDDGLVVDGGVARQLESERRLRYEAEDRLKRFTLATASDNCAASRMPESGIDILRE